MKISDVIREIETKFNVKNVKSNNLALWLEFRNRFFYRLSIGKESNLVIDSQLYLVVIKSMFYGFFNWFGNYDAWVFSSSLNRIKIEEGYYDKLFDYPASKFKKALFIELSTKPHFKRSEVVSKFIVSRAPLIILEKLISTFIIIKKIDISVINDIQKEYGTEIDAGYSIKKILSQYKAMKIFLFFKKKPKVVFVAPLYMSFGYIKALKEKKITVIEGQHGVINKEHFGYNFYEDFDTNYFPDYLLSFGEREKEVFGGMNKFINQEKVIPVGSFYIDYVNNKYETNIDTGKYRLTFSVSMQDCSIGSHLLPFLISVSKSNKDCLFLLKTRRTPIVEYTKRFDIPNNIKFVENQDVYQNILNSDYHITAYSSCALEAPALGFKNILINFENKAKEYYIDVLDEKTTTFVDSEEEFNKLILGIKPPSRDEIKNFHRKVMKTSYKSNIDKFLKLIG